MHRDASTAYLIVGSISIVGCAIAIVFLKNYLAIGPLFIGIPLLIIGLNGLLRPKHETERSDGKSRDAARTLSLFPSMGHFYLRSWKRGLMVLLSILIPVFLSFFCLYAMEIEDSIIFFVYITIMATFSFIWSIVDAQRICDSLHLPSSEDSFMDLKIKNYNLAENILFIGTFAVLVLFSALFIHYKVLEDTTIIRATMLLSSILPLYVLVKHFLKRDHIRSE